MSTIGSSHLDSGMPVHAPQYSVSQIWDWCSEAYLRRGRKLTAPAGTKLEESYPWHYATSLTKRINDHGFDEQTAKFYIGFAVDYAAKRGLLQKGLSILLQQNLIDACLTAIDEQKRRCENIRDSIVRARRFVTKKANGQSLVDVLETRRETGAICNLVIWFRASLLPIAYVAVAPECQTVIKRLSPSERSMLPTDVELYRTRLRIKQLWS